MNLLIYDSILQNSINHNIKICAYLIQHMSVKEKIALYNNLAAHDQEIAAQNLLKKGNNTNPNLKPKTQEQKDPSKIQQAQNHSQQNEPNTVKIEQNHPSISKEVKPVINNGTSAEPHQNMSEGALTYQQGNKQEASLPSQNQVLKKLEQQFASKGFSFMVPPENKKIAENLITGPKGGLQLDVEKDIQIGSVKEHAVKLSEFYKNQNSNSLKDPQPGFQVNFQYSSPQPVPVQDFKPAESSNNCLNITTGTFYSQGGSFPVQSAFPEPQWESPPWEIKDQLQVRQTNKSKGARQVFEDDD